MAETLLSFGVEKLWDLLAREFESFQGFNEQFDELKRDLNLLRSFLEDADAKKHTNKMVQTCVKEIKEIVFDAEDIIETFLLKKELGQTSGIRKRMRRLSCIVMDRRKIGSDIGGISKRISKVIRDMQGFGVQQMTVEDRKYSLTIQERQREIRKTFPTNYENNLVGVENNVKKLVGYLVEEDSVQVVSITGMGGIGKTTLARQVFNHEIVKNHFDGVAWVCISQEFTRTYVWQEILQQLSSKHNEQIDSNMGEDMLQRKLSRLLETSNSLIVLDDMWKEEDWDRIQPGFPSMKGWKVLLTSRYEKVALRVDPSCVTFKPESLTIEESWTLFRMIAFPKDTSEYKIDEEMEEMGKKMIKLCGGLPLAVKVLGGLLAAQHTLSEWKRIYKNIGSHIFGGTSFNERNINSVYHILSLSFEELPIYLKQCFLYLAHFPEDYTIYVGKLSYYWAVEGIPRPRHYDGATIREVADGVIEELVNRNMVISERDATTSRFETCHLHDIMREGCLEKAKEENFVETIDPSTVTSTSSSQSPCNSRRLVIHSSVGTTHMEKYIKNRKLRSLLVIKEFYRSDWMVSALCFTKLQLMRILDLSYVKFEGGKLPSNIGKLIHLRYLSLYKAKVSHLPSSMRNLRKLLYLNLFIAMISPVYVPNFMKEMREMTYLHLPEMMHNKIKLELGDLVNLETLEKFSIEHSNVKDLQRMKKVRNLSIKVRLEEDIMPILEKLPQLEKVILERYAGTKMVCSGGGFPQLQKLRLYDLEEWEEWIVEEGSMPLLHTLEISYCPKLKKFPNGGFLQLHTLELYRLEEWEEWIVEEGSMPLLHTLEISYCPTLKKFPNGGFPQLHELKLKGLDEWEEWIVEEGSMPLLHTLDIWECPKLKEFPNGGFPQLQKLFLYKLEEWEEWIVEEGYMPLLHTLDIRNCPKLKKFSNAGFPQLQKLVLSGLEDWEEWIVEEGSMPLLHTLEISYCPKLKKFPDGGFPQLHELKLNGLDEWEEWIVEEGSMPLLHTLQISYCPKLKKFPNGGFPQLQKLNLNGLDEWEEWIVEEGSMPLLHTLQILDCRKLKELPNGLRFIYSLKKLKMDEEWKERLSEGGEDYYKVQHIPSIEF